MTQYAHLPGNYNSKDLSNVCLEKATHSQSSQKIQPVWYPFPFSTLFRMFVVLVSYSIYVKMFILMPYPLPYQDLQCNLWFRFWKTFPPKIHFLSISAFFRFLWRDEPIIRLKHGTNLCTVPCEHLWNVLLNERCIHIPVKIPLIYCTVQREIWCQRYILL